ncbi:hypothetical protein GCM10011425_06460 [Mucilaginibacter galii]|uniref:Glycoside hydrolase family 5 domain-containing protein n=2 Tax=Mucilaginibacter galii TaxID=2005073 RepID=A0A917J681_9SPHI|nr:hypothetical protein GCM10011425_06460 [Mucilaginibacter galii]
MMFMKRFFIIAAVLVAFGLNTTYAQKQAGNLVYVDQEGAMRWTARNQKAFFFGMNYTVPFAFGYRSHQKLNINPEKAIDNDVYHMARLGLDAFRVHVWDTEISDATGNLKNNEHLRLFDYLVAQLKKRHIYIVITPIAFWGNGYPERDEKTGSFSDKYGKDGALTKEEAFKAQENYLKQFFKHVNPYTGLAYKDDPQVIATEINNEPHHTGSQTLATTYINRMIKAVKSTGWSKPVFYNISESPRYAGAVSASDADGFSFQWYPTGLVAGHTQLGNRLPNVAKYTFPYDTIPSFAKRARMVYEFDAGDVLQSVMYPMMAKSFRAAGFQWATQFAYDPMATANVNTEYQTHYLNLAYTPAKAIGLMIAGQVFHQENITNLNAAGYPADSVFGAYKVSYKQQLSQLNSDKYYYYTNTTTDVPVNPTRLMHVAGVGASPVVNYKGTGAYFLDRLAGGQWRLEIMPDAMILSDPFAKASPQKQVAAVVWQANAMQINLPGLGSDFEVTGLNNGNDYRSKASNQTITLSPGTYLLKRKGTKSIEVNVNSTLGLREFVAPAPEDKGIQLIHTPLNHVAANIPFTIETVIAGVGATDSVMVQMNNLSGVYSMVKMQRSSALAYRATVPATLLTPGLLQYRIMVYGKNKTYHTFPGNHEGDPFGWDYAHDDYWQTYVNTPRANIELFSATADRQQLNAYVPDWRATRLGYTTMGSTSALAATLSNKSETQQTVGFETIVEDKIKYQLEPALAYNDITFNATAKGQAKVKVILVDRDGFAFAATVEVSATNNTYTIPLNAFMADEQLLLPRPYPGFLPLWFKAQGKHNFNLRELSKVQLVAWLDKNEEVAVSSISLQAGQ